MAAAAAAATSERTIVTSPGMSMDSTPFSRTRRAISCVYCGWAAWSAGRMESTRGAAERLGRLLAGGAAAAHAPHMHIGAAPLTSTQTDPRCVLANTEAPRLAVQAASGSNSAARAPRPPPAFPTACDRPPGCHNPAPGRWRAS